MQYDGAGARSSQLFQQGSRLYEKGMLAEAERIFELLLARDGRDFACLYNLGTICARQGRHDEAIAYFRRAIKQNAKVAAVYNNLGNALRATGHDRAAIREYERAVALDPLLAEAHNNLASALHAADRLDEARARYQAAIDLRPGYAEAHANLGTALLTAGRLEQAIEHLETAVRLAPERGEYLRRLVRARPFRADDPLMPNVRAVEQELDALPPDQQIAFHFALGKIYGDLEDHEIAFRHMSEGNRLKRQATLYDETAALAYFDAIRESFPPELLAPRPGRGDPTTVPIFVVGMPRSGTTLVEQVLASHRGVFGAGEIDDLTAELSRVPMRAGAPVFPRHIRSLSDQQLSALGAGYATRLRARAPTAERVVDKMPGNFHFLGLVSLILPNARIIHVRRDPLDTCFSCFSRLFVDMHASAYSLPELGRYYRAYEALMAHWRRVLPDGAMIDVQYETLVDDLEGQARRLVAHCGLDWDPNCLAFHHTERSVKTASAAQVRQPLYRSSVGIAATYRPWLQPLIDELAKPPV